MAFSSMNNRHMTTVMIFITAVVDISYIMAIPSVNVNVTSVM